MAKGRGNRVCALRGGPCQQPWRLTPPTTWPNSSPNSRMANPTRAAVRASDVKGQRSARSTAQAVREAVRHDLSGERPAPGANLRSVGGAGKPNSLLRLDRNA